MIIIFAVLVFLIAFWMTPMHVISSDYFILLEGADC